MIHVRLTVPADLADDVAGLLVGDPCVVHVVRHAGASLDPSGDAFAG